MARHAHRSLQVLAGKKLIATRWIRATQFDRPRGGS